MNISNRHYEHGGVSGSLIAIIGLSVLSLGLGIAAILAYMNYAEQKRNVDDKINLAVIEAKKNQSDADDKKFAEREKEPNRKFVGPDDYGRLTFNYPKTWSVYVASDASKGGNYSAYLNPVSVSSVSDSQLYALRVSILEQTYEDVIQNYDGQVKSGKLKSTATSSNGKSGTRLDGTFSSNVRGAIVIYKLRDKTITIQTDAETFKPDFETIIKTIDFNS